MSAPVPAPGLVVRPARPEDDASVGELLIEAFVETYARKLPEVVVTERRKAELRAVADKRAVAHVWVAELDGQLVGTVSLWPPNAPGSEAFIPDAADIRHMAVSPRHRGLGISRALLDAAEARAWELGARAICLHVRREATGVAGVYRARGYQRRPEGDLDYLPEVFLEAYLLPPPA